jgi:hypothetical protein
MLTYELLGEGAEHAFVRSWGVSRGLNAASEWQDVARTALEGALLLVLLENLYLTRHAYWLEARPCSRRASVSDTDAESVSVLMCATYHAGMRVQADASAAIAAGAR